MTNILSEHFRDPEMLIHNIYCNGGIRVHGYGSISRGYGGGIDIDQAHSLFWLDGYLTGVGVTDKAKGHTLLKAINTALKEKYPDVTDENVPFINLTEAT